MAEKPKKKIAKKAVVKGAAKKKTAVKKAVKKKAVAKPVAKKKAETSPTKKAMKKPAKKAVKKKAVAKPVAKKKVAKKKAVAKPAAKKKAVKKKAVAKPAAKKKTVKKVVFATTKVAPKVKKVVSKAMADSETTKYSEATKYSEVAKRKPVPQEKQSKVAKVVSISKPEKPIKQKTTIPIGKNLSKKPEEISEESEIEAAKYFTPVNDEDFEIRPDPMDENELPEMYFDEKIVLMARDPFWCYAYWDISKARFDEMAADMNASWGGYKMVLRLYDVTGVSFDGNNANKFVDVSVSLDATNWYINIPSSGTKYVADIGFKSDDGHFLTIARSNEVSAPVEHAVATSDEEWMEIDEDFDEIFRVSENIVADSKAGAGVAKTKTEAGAAEIQRSVSIGASDNVSLGDVLSSETVSSFSSPAGGDADSHENKSETKRKTEEK